MGHMQYEVNVIRVNACDSRIVTGFLDSNIFLKNADITKYLKNIFY